MNKEYIRLGSLIQFFDYVTICKQNVSVITFSNFQTHKDSTNYRYAVAFTLAQNYGTKRIMSSYYFGDDSDQGPPQTSPGCGNEWVCEHRWKSIGNFSKYICMKYECKELCA